MTSGRVAVMGWNQVARQDAGEWWRAWRVRPLEVRRAWGRPEHRVTCVDTAHTEVKKEGGFQARCRAHSCNPNTQEAEVG